jgi:hypothetical protein
MKFLKRMKDLSPERTLKYRLHQYLGGPKPGRSYKRIHASELTKAEGFCPRFVALMCATNAKVPDEYLITSLAVTFRIGNDLQDSLVNWFADMDVAVGHWKCGACGHLHEFCKRPQQCSTCGCKAIAPVEPRFTSAYSGASCGVDMLASLGNPKLTPVEIKTIDKEEFKGLVAPLSEHRQRTSLYLRIIEESDHPFSQQVDTQEARVFYVSKGGYGCLDDEVKKWGIGEQFSPFKEFTITRNDTVTEEPTKRARAAYQYMQGEVGMPEGICETALGKRAKRCPKVKECFSGKFPAEHEWRSKEA